MVILATAVFYQHQFETVAREGHHSTKQVS